MMMRRFLSALGVLAAIVFAQPADAGVYVAYDRIAQLSTTTGTGTITLGTVYCSSGSVCPYQTFAGAGVPSGSTVRYYIVDGTNWERGFGVYTSSGTTLTRNSQASSNSGSAITLDGAEIVYTSWGADDFNSLACPQTTLTASGSTFTPNLDTSCQFALTLATGDTIANPTNPFPGQQYTLAVAQPSSGGPFTVSWGAGYSWASGSAPTLNTGASAVTIISCQVLTNTPTQLCWGPTNGAFLPSTTAASPTAPASTSAFKAQGLSSGVTQFTPATTGSMTFTINGNIVAGTGTTTAAGTGIEYAIIYGTGNGPANAGTPGTVCGTTQEYKNGSTQTAGDIFKPFEITCNVSGLTIGTAYYLDLEAESVSVASAIGLGSVSMSANENR